MTRRRKQPKESRGSDRESIGFCRRREKRRRIESFLAGNDVGLVSVSLDDSGTSCDQDGVLDRDESGKLKITLKNVGINVLSAATLKVTSPIPGVTIGNNGVVTLPAFGPFATASAEFPVSLAGVLGVQNLRFELEIDDASLVSRPVRGSASLSSRRASVSRIERPSPA